VVDSGVLSGPAGSPAAPAATVTAAPSAHRRPWSRAVAAVDRRALLIGLVAAGVLFAVLMVRQPYLFQDRLVAWGDDAVAAIEIDDAKHLTLVDGNNSRIGTSHPGPAYYYVEAAAEVVMYDVTSISPEPLNAHRTGAAALNAIFFGTLVALFATRARTWEVVLVGVAVVGMLTVLPSVFAGSWLPYLYCLPFLLAMAAAGAILAGERRAVVPYVVASWFLIHGHVGFLLNVGGMSAFVAGVLAWRHRHEPAAFLRRHRSAIRSGALASVPFLIPLIANLFINWPHPWKDYVDYARETENRPRSISDVADFVGHYLTWRHEVPAGLAIGLAAVCVAAVLTLRADALRRLLTWQLVTAGVALALFTVYAVRGVDDLSQTYTGNYAFTIPALVVVVGVVALARRFERAMPAFLAVALVVAVGTARSADAFTSPDRGSLEVATIADTLEADPARADRTIALEFEAASWPWAVAVMQYGTGIGLHVCAVDAFWEWFVTDRFICGPADRAEGWHLRMVMATTDDPPGLVLRSTSVVLTDVAAAG
jgi:hypothetical protein